MPVVNLSPAKLKSALTRFRRVRVLVVGDLMLDEFIYGRVSRISPEAPVPVVHVEREQAYPGGAANVARNLAALGIHAELSGGIGQDARRASCFFPISRLHAVFINHQQPAWAKVLQGIF